MKQLRWVLLIAPALLLGCASHPPTVPEETAIYDPPPPVPASAGAIYSPGYGISLFQDRRARQIGDTLTVLLTERTQAQKSAATTTSKATDVAIANPTLFGRTPTLDGQPLFETAISSENGFSGSGASSQSNQLDGSVTVTVVDVLNNGNLVVQGEKWITINQGQEFVKLRGVIRPDDINPDNSVASTRIAQAKITYNGRGAVADANAMGWGARFFNSPFWPF
ncbi:MAG: flagellar basal body L-ring protein FlgH [Salinisphaeraceae bacterium]|jgi:flagellar L-ring protein precursor FlgH|nr:flagellar basal body L-ring protein FlgH [Salinisphaeraceae bacterium]